MTLTEDEWIRTRDKFAGIAMAEIMRSELRDQEASSEVCNIAYSAMKSYEMADAMMDAREPTEDKGNG